MSLPRTVTAVLAQSARVPKTYLVDLGAGWGSVFHADLRYIEPPRRLHELRDDDPRWQPWEPPNGHAVELPEEAEAAIRASGQAIRARFGRLA
jgi:hypothetical protein